ncbi:uncharacterized protein FA14DRAFT_157695 [Meira miltonrushii]|uniref:Uncharacterized protein n=1 Tax=Meira miltonrushii TaxID=1280837 RepID=A0A316V6G8_9BASI|nr:uncharacterized protein FA14DRAFT_157695 [Meira miltonrushii]PWN33012.1 hypothetical protein FA14DRAFT_157695 [Meira miltonrushii]
MIPPNDDDLSHSVILPNHPFRTSTHEAMRTLSAGVGKGSNKAQARRSSHTSVTLQSQFRNPSTTSINLVQQQQQRSSILSPQKSAPVNGGNVEHDLVMESPPTNTPKTTFASRLSRLFLCGGNPALYEQEGAIVLQTVSPAKKTQVRPSLKRRSSFFSLSARNPMALEVEYEEAYTTSSSPIQLTTPPAADDIQPIPQQSTANVNKNIPTDNLHETQAEIMQPIQQLHEGVKKEAPKELALPRARKYDTVPSSEACEYTGRKYYNATETQASSQPPLPQPQKEERRLFQKDEEPQDKGKLPLPEMAHRRESARSLRSYVSSSSLYSAASAQERAFVNTPGEISLADDWGMAASPSRSITSTQLGQSPFMFDLLAKFPGLSSSTTQQPSGLRHMLGSETFVEEERARTPHPPGFMPDEDSDTEGAAFQRNSMWQNARNDTPPARLRREGTTTMYEAASPTSSLSNSTLETPSPPIATMNRKRLAVLNGVRLENNFAARMASMDNGDTDWRDNLIGLYTDDDIVVPFPQSLSQQHRQSVSSATDSFHSTNPYQATEDSETESRSANHNNNKPGMHISADHSRLYEGAPVPPPDVPLPPIPAHQSMEAHNLSKSQRTIRKASLGRHRGNSDASARSNATMKAGSRSKHSRRA